LGKRYRKKEKALRLRVTPRTGGARVSRAESTPALELAWTEKMSDKGTTE
jgi:hypothetical protein